MYVVATTGHADDGKSALLQALTGIEPDRAATDRSQEFDLDFAWLTLPSGTKAAFVDVPGHDRFMATLLTGAAGASAVMFVVAADQGWTSHSAEQLAVVSSLGIRHALLVVTKCDVADPAPILADATARIARCTHGEVSAIAVSSITGAGVPDLVSALDRLCVRLPEPDTRQPARIWIDRSISTTSGAAVVTGTLLAGTVHKDEDLLVAPAMRPVRIHELRSLGGPADAVTGIARVALELHGVGRDALCHGMALVQPGRWTLTDVIDVRTRPVLPPQQADGAWTADQRVNGAIAGQLPRSLTLHIGSAKVVSRVRPLGSGIARLSLADPLPLHVGDRVLLRDSGTRRPESWPAVSGAVVLDVAPPPLGRRGAAAAAARQLAAWPDRPTAADLLARHGLLRGSALFAMGVAELPEPVAGEWLADPDHWRALGYQLGEVLAAYAAAEPLTAGMPVEAARSALDLPDRRLVTALATPPFRISSGAVHIGAPPPATTSRQQLPEAVLAAIQVLRADLGTAPFVSPDAGRLRKLGLDGHSIAAAVRAGQLMRISDQVVLAPGADVAAAAVLAALEQPFTAAAARQALCTTRRTAIPLLEFLDAAGITERLADDRRLVRAQPAPEPGPCSAQAVAARG